MGAGFVVCWKVLQLPCMEMPFFVGLSVLFAPVPRMKSFEKGQSISPSDQWNFDASKHYDAVFCHWAWTSTSSSGYTRSAPHLDFRATAPAPATATAQAPAPRRPAQQHRRRVQPTRRARGAESRVSVPGGEWEGECGGP